MTRRVRRCVEFGTLMLAMSSPCFAAVLPPMPRGGCERAVVEGELNAGKAFSAAIGGGLKVYFQPIHSGWILRILPVSGPVGEHDYAELATPPYQSVTPLSISTDFAFRAQDAVGWNPRRFRFATSSAGFRALEQAYLKFEAAGAAPGGEVQAELARQIAQGATGTLTFVDARLVPGTADQWRMAGAVASHFSTTAHTLVDTPGEAPSALGRLVWMRFRLELDLPAGFRTNPELKPAPRNCGKP